MIAIPLRRFVAALTMAVALASASLFAQAPVNKPDTDSAGIVTTDAYDEQGLIWGWADTHAHMFSNLGFGGYLFHGEPINSPYFWFGGEFLLVPEKVNGVSEAMPWCGTFDQPLPHGVGGIGDLIGNAIRTGNPFSGHWVGGFPEMDGWPRWEDVNHQKMYFRWLERAFRGGQKLMVMQAVNNEVLCRASNQKPGYGCDDMDAVDRQIAATKQTEQWIDLYDNGEADGSGWFRIAYSPAEARQHIAAGKMAVVLGIEVDSLFGCKVGECSKSYVERKLDEYYEQGVRHLYPIHVFNNAFGGSALYNPTFNTGNRVVNGDYMTLESCRDEGYRFNANATDFFTNLFASATFGIEFPPAYDGTAHCNTRGLTSLGRHLITGMMAKGMIIDVDHMSRTMLDQVLDMAEDNGLAYPLVSGHGGYTEISSGAANAEGSRTPAQLARMRALGGMVAPNLYQGGTADIHSYSPTVPHDCGYSARTWAQTYLYAVDQMRGGPGLLGVGMGTDFNGFVKSPAPRVGSESLDLKPCGDDMLAAQVVPGTPGRSLVTYPFDAHGKPGRFFEQRTGLTEYNINRHGVAHAGLLPDFIQELKMIGVSSEQLEPLFHSAEKYLQVWERAIARGQSAPLTEVTVTPAANAAGWHRAPATVTFTGSASGPFGGEAATIHLQSTGAQPDWNSAYPAPAVAALVDHNGTTVFTYRTEDTSGNQETARQLTIRLDQADPIVMPVLSAPANGAGWHRDDVAVTLTPSDAHSGVLSLHVRVNGAGFVTLSGGSPRIVTVTDEGEHTIEYFARDLAGNVGDTKSLFVRLDKTAPEVMAVQMPPAGPSGWNREEVAVTWTASDALSGVSGLSTDDRLVTAQGVTAVARLFTDRAGNTTLKIVSTRIDSIPPVVTWSTPAGLLGDGGWFRSAVRFTPSASDATSGVAALPGLDDVVVTSEGAGVSGAMTVADVAGNVTIATTPPVSIDRTAPTITATRTPANQHGWNNQSVAVQFECQDQLSGINACAGDSTVTAEGAGQSVAGTATDRAGNSATHTVAAINVDLTAPVVTVAIAPSANQAGWHQSPVTATWSAADVLSGLAATATATTSFNTDGAGLSAAQTFSDRAGNQATVTSPPINLDRTAPTITATRTPANQYGWNNQSVTVQFDCQDQLSGVNACAGSSTVTAEGAGQSVAGTVTDRAGNAAAHTVAAINIDFTAPVVTVAIAPAANQAGWHQSPVTASWSATDALSGLAGPGTATTSFNTDGSGLSATQAFSDRAGNQTTVASPPVNVDRTAPTLSCGPSSPTELWPPNGKLVPVQFTVAVEPGATFVLQSLVASESSRSGPLFDGFVLGTADVTGRLAADRNSGRSPRVYTATFVATDPAGNSAQCLGIVVVPANQGQGGQDRD
jgi:microsomal dipeptidase-like Zn-dependent dipeptidase/multisubunit Na+/H+ antiporter MnhG subunit